MTQATAQTTAPGGPIARPSSSVDRESLHHSFAADGYVVVPNLVSRDKLSSLREALIGAFDQGKRAGTLMAGGGLISGHLNCFPGEGSTFAYEALEANGIIDFVKEVTPRPFTVPNVRCNFNLPKSVAQHRHIDGAYLDRFTIVNIAVVDTDLVNGAIELIPGTHKKFYKYWRFATEKPYRFAKRISMKCGDVLIRTSTLWHRGMPNRSATPRPMLAFTFGDPHEEERAEPFQTNGGKIAFYENWYRPTLLGRLRERTFVIAPFTYSSYRFVSSLFGNKGYGTP